MTAHEPPTAIPDLPADEDPPQPTGGHTGDLGAPDGQATGIGGNAGDDDHDPVDLPPTWTDVDDQIYDLRIRQRLPWREVGRRMGMSGPGAHRRFYRRMAQVDPAEIVAMRAEENAKLDDRESRAMLVWTVAMRGVPLLHNGQPVLAGFGPNGEPLAAVDRDLRTALASLREEHRVAQHRAKLNGLNPPTHIVIDDASAEAEIEAAITSYLQGRDDLLAELDAGDRALGGS